MSSGGEVNIRVLHVDDNPSFGEIVTDFLEENNRITVDYVESAREGLDYIENEAVDCVVSDYEMPEVDGIEFLEKVREMYPDLPFILFTGKGSEEIAGEAISKGVTDYLQKETGTEQYKVLANRIENVVERRRTQHELSTTRKQYQQLVEQSIVGIYIIQDGEIEYINPTSAEIFGYDREELIGMSPLELVAEKDREKVKQNLRKRLEGDVEEIRYSFTAIKKGGEPIEVEVHGQSMEYRGEPAIMGVVHDITEREERERRLSTLISNLPGVAYRCENVRGWPMEFVGGECEELTGYTAETVQSGEVSWGRDIIHPEDRGMVWNEVQNAIENDESFTLIYRIWTRDGEEKWVWEKGRGVGRQVGDHEALEGFITDITERKEHEQSLRALHEAATDIESCETTDEVYEILIRVSNEILEHDSAIIAEARDGELIPQKESPNVAGKQYQEKDPIPVDSEDIGAKSYRKSEPLVVDDLSDIENESISMYRSVLAVPIGEHGVWKTMSRNPNGFDEKDVELAELLISYVSGVLDRIEYRRELEQTNEQLEAVLENTTAHIYIKDLKGRYRLVNEKFAERLGMERNEIIGKTDEEIQDPEIAKNVRENDEKAIQEQKTIEVEESAKWGDESRIYYSVKSPLIDEDGEPKGVCGVSSDITELKKREEELERKTERLDNFAKIVSHDLRNPLNIATANLEMVRREHDDDHLEAVTEAHERMERLIDDLLTLAREGGEIEDLESVKVHKVAQKCWEKTKPEPYGSDIDDGFRPELEIREEFEIKANERRLKQVFENLFRNSIEHSSLGSDTDSDQDAVGNTKPSSQRTRQEEVSVRVGEIEDLEGFYVEDNGPGIPEEKRDKVFEPGFTMNEKSSGFGLWIVKEIVEKHGWKIELKESEEGGARFEIYTGKKS